MRWGIDRGQRAIHICDYLCQLEVETEEGWKPVVRFDPLDEGPHVDQYKNDGTCDKRYLDFQYDDYTGYKDAFDDAYRFICQNWRELKQRFERGWWPLERT